MAKQRNSMAQRLRRIGLVLVVLTVTACGGDGGDAPADDEAANQEPQYGGSLTVGVEAESNCWTPDKGSWGGSGQTISRTIFDSLMIRAEDGSTVPMLAESLESNEDFTEWTLTLRPDITFHDGTALTADVLVTIFNDYLKVPGAVTASSLTGATIAAVDELTVVYTLAVPNAAFSERLTGNVGMPFSIEAVQRFGEDACANPVGTGPFVFQEWVVDDRLIVTRNEDYWWQGEDAPPYLDEIVFRVITDGSAMLATFLAGDIDAFTSVSGNIINRARQESDGDSMKIYEFIGDNGTQIIYNTLRPPVDDVRVRQALTAASDQEGLISVLGNEGISPIKTQYYGPDSIWYSEEVAGAWPNFDPERAADLLQDYADDPDRSDGQPVGSPVAVEIQCPASPDTTQLAQALQSLWADVGFQVNVKSVEQAVHFQTVSGSPDSNPPFIGNYQTACWREGADSDPFNLLERFFQPSETSLTNRTNLYDDVIREQFSVLQRTDDFDTRFAALETLHMHFIDEMPHGWAGGTPFLTGVNPSVMNLDSWTLPDGSAGTGAVGINRWAFVWLNP